MAIIKCPECGGNVSDSAATCPHCGFSLADLKRCSQCNHVITENDASCPECGSPTPWSRKCPSCGKFVLINRDYCPECGFDMISHYGRVNLSSTSSTVGSNIYQPEYDEFEDDEEKPSRKKWFIIGGLLLIVAAMAAWFFIGKGINPTMKCIITDSHGQIYGINEKPICAATMYSDNEPFHITFESTVDLFGTNVTEVYLRSGQVYTEFPYSARLDALTPVAEYSHIKDSGTWTFTFSKVKPVDEKDIPLERKLRNAKSKEEVEQLINGTTWHYTEPRGGSSMSAWVQVEFNNGRFTCYSAQPSDGRWTQTGSGTYKVSEGRFDNTGEYYVSIDWNADYKYISTGTIPCQFSFYPINRQIDVRCEMLDMANRGITGNYYAAPTYETGTMTLGDYNW